MVTITYAPKFVRQFKKFKPAFREQVEERIALFVDNPKNPSLRTHKLHGDLKDRWAFSIDYRYRIVFQFTSSKEVNFLAIDDHDIYKR